MRVILFILSALSVFSSCRDSAANPELQNENEVRKALSNNWEATHMELGRTRIKLPEEKVTTLLFHKSGTFSSGVKNGVIVDKGEWDYDPKTHTLEMGKGEEKGLLKILKLTGQELILMNYMSINDKIFDSTVMTYKKL